MSPTRANRVAASIVAVGIAGLALVLGLWQGVDDACGGDDFDPSEPLSTCQAPDEVNVERVSADPVDASLTGR